MQDHSQIKVLVLPSFYPMEHNYVRGNFFEEQAILLKKKGLDISVVFNENRSVSSFNLKKLKYVHFQKKMNLENGLPVFRRMTWNLIPTRFEIGRKIWIRTFIRLVEEYFRRYGHPDLIHVHCALDAGSVCLFLKKKYKIPYVITEHSTYFALNSLSEKKRKEVREVYQNAEKVVVVSNPFKSLLSEKTGFDSEKINVIPNFIDSDYFKPSTDISSSKGPIVLFTVCHHVYKKRLDRLLEAFKMVSARYPDCKLIIGGNGAETERLKKMADSFQFKNVTFPGFLSKEQVREFLKEAHIFVLPSDVETFGVVLIEALSMGIPVVATKSGGPEDIITTKTGVLTEKDATSLANGIINVITNYENYDKEYIRDYAVNNFSGKTVAEKYLEVYTQVLKINCQLPASS